MARKTTASPDEAPANLAVPRSEAEAKLRERIEKGTELRNREIRTIPELEAAKAEQSKWSSYNFELLKRLFTTSAPAEEYARFYGAVVRANPSPQERLEKFHEDVSDRIHRLESILERLELYDEPVSPSQASVPLPKGARNKQSVFLVHGQDDAAREATARLLERLQLNAIILHEQASGGRTIIEKLEHYADVDFALVLLTPDDVGAAKADAANLRPRARQNVVLELGLFIGCLGRAHVCALHKGDIELPSDFVSVVYVPMDDGGAWKYRVGKELIAAGFAVDLNRIA
ncbi:MAG TPA: nucleotide-binding protein [Acidobacteriaceae bacterium]|nr:nucleotide-binding protein [Acidobacteriaceae bacterium]